jgi:outer membrane protein OmpA-like peptidoglycan-associated protein
MQACRRCAKKLRTATPLNEDAEMNRKLFTAMGLACGLAACATMPASNAALETARSDVQSAEADPNVSKYAALDLEAAKRNLGAAEDAWQHHDNAAASQSAYLATQSAHIAQAHGAAKADDARVAAGQAQRDQIMLAARTQEAEAAKTQRDQAQAELEALKATQTARGSLVTLGDVLFDTGKAQLKPGTDLKLDQLAQFLKEHPDRRIRIEGFTDNTGSDAFNEELSQRRADAVKAALMERNVDPSRIGTEGYGKAYPVASNNDSGGRQLNRRVEVVIGAENGSPVVPRG